MRRVWRWIRRIVLATAVLVVIAIAIVVIGLHTAFGRELVRARIEAKLAEVVVGGAHLGAVEGSPFGTLVLRDLVLDGPDGLPAITVPRISLELGLLPLLARHARIDDLVIDDAEVIVKRDAEGGFQLAHLLRPAPKSGWSVELAAFAIHRARVTADAGAEVIHLEGLELLGAARVPAAGPIDATIQIRGAWRERAMAVALDAVVRAESGVLSVPQVIATVGGVTVVGAGVRIATVPSDTPVLAGTVIVRAPAAAESQLPGALQLPADVAFAATVHAHDPGVASTRSTPISVIGQLGPTPIRALLAVDVAERELRGVVASPSLDLTTLTGGRVRGAAGGLVMFEARLGAAGQLPSARGVLMATGEVEGIPSAHAAIAFVTDGEHAGAVLGLRNDALTLALSADVTRAGSAVSLDRATLRASSSDPSRATGARAALRGAVEVELSAHGTLLPAPALAVAGKVHGRAIRMAGVSVASLDLALAASGLPGAPHGRAALDLRGVTRGKLALGALAVTAADRADGRIQVSVRSRPVQRPWLIDLDALVTLPSARGARADTYVIDVQRHHVRAGEGSDWQGTGGRLELGPQRLVITGLRSASAGASLALAGSYVHAGRGAGALVIDASAASETLGAARLLLDLAAPAHPTRLAAWTQLAQSAIRSGQLTLERADLARVAALAGRPGEVSGRLEGTLVLSATKVIGSLQLRDGQLPAVRGASGVSADVAISQPAPGELSAKLTANVGPDLATLEALARLRLPARLFDPHAWRQLGRAALLGASVRVAAVEFDPAVLARLGLSAELRGKISLAAELTEQARTAQVSVEVTQLRGGAIVQPIDLRLAATLDERELHAALAASSRGVTLAAVEGTASVSRAELWRDPGAVLRAPLALTGQLPRAQAAALLAVFGRSEIVGGTIEGTLEVAGTVARPTGAAHLIATQLAVPPGPANRPIKMLDRITIDASWDGARAKVALDGVERAGSLKVAADLDPQALRAGTLTISAKAFDLAPLLAFAPGAAAGGAGRLDANLTIVGLDPGTAQVAGELHLQGARLPIAPSVGTLRRASVDVVIGARSMTIAAKGRLGSGDLALASTLALEGARPTGGEATLTLRKVSPIGTVEPVIDADVTAKLERRGDQWFADVVVRNGHVVVPSARGEKLKPVGAPTDMVLESGEQITRRPMKKQVPQHAAVTAKITLDATSIDSEEVRSIVKGSVTVTADLEAIGVVGRVEADRGEVDLFGRRYQVERAAVNFDGSIDPLLDLRITHDFADVTTVTNVRGRLSKPELQMSSDPGTYSQGQLLGFLLGGEPTGDPSTSGARDQVTGVGASYIANKLGGFVRGALPIDLDVLRYEAATAVSSAAVTVGTWLSRSLFVAYRYRLDARPDENSGEGELEYWLSRRISVEGTVGDRGYDGVDVLWRKRY